MKQTIVTTSWDDGHKLDVRLSELLEKYHMKGTFYISPQDHEFVAEDRLTDEQIKEVGNRFEIGAHTMTHPRLTEVSDERARREMVESKNYLERLLGRPVTTFCYPGGNYQAKHVKLARESGFLYARTVRRHRFNLKGSMLEGDTTVNAYNHYQDLWKIARFARFNPVRTYRYFQWDVLAKAMFDRTLREGGVYHLWGHSWEIDKFGYWEKLEDVLRYISDRQNVRYVTNGELPELQPKRLLIAASYFPPHLGGVEFYVYNTAKQLQSLGWKVSIATSGKTGLRMRKTNYHGLTVYRLPALLKLSNTPLNPFWPRMLRRIIKQEDIYLVNVHAPVPGLPDMAAAVARRAHLSSAVTYHMLSMAKGKSSVDWLIRLYEQKVLPKMLDSAQVLVCSSDPIREKFLRAHRSKSLTITPGVDTVLFKPAASLPKDTLLYVGSTARTDKHKGISVLLQAMRRIVKEYPDVKLFLVGEGDGRIEYEAQAVKHGIANHVTFLGGKYDADLHDAFRKATVFVLPTFNDSFAMVVLEAMASGLPVVSTPVGAIPTLVKDGASGYLVQPGDSDALAEKLVYLLKHPKVAAAFGGRGRERSEQGFSWESKARNTDVALQAALHDTYQGQAE